MNSAARQKDYVMSTVKPGHKVDDSGIYEDTSSKERSTLVRGKTAPPTGLPGGQWKQVVDTNSRDKTSRNGR